MSDHITRFMLFGGIAQLGEHLPCKQGVKSSSLFISIPYEILEKVYRKGIDKRRRSMITYTSVKSKKNRIRITQNKGWIQSEP